MKSLLALFLSGLFLISPLADICAQEEETTEERVLLLRQAQEHRKNTVAVEAYLIGNILEAKITARMPKSRPNIYNAIIVGPKLGRLSPEARETLLQTIDSDEEEPYPTEERGAFISFRERTRARRSKGRLTRELVVFEIPREEIVKDKKYKLWVQIKSGQEAGYRQKGGRYVTFKFELEDLPELLEANE